MKGSREALQRGGEVWKLMIILSRRTEEVMKQVEDKSSTFSYKQLI